MKKLPLTIDVFDHNANRIVDMEMKLISEEEINTGLKRTWVGEVSGLPNGGDARIEILECPPGTINMIEKSESVNSPEEAIREQFLNQLA